MFKAKYDEESKCVVIEKDGVSLSLTESEFRQAADDINKKLYYKEDVEGFLEDLTERGDLEEDVAKDPEFIQDMVDEYTKIREDHSADWETCLECAFDRLDLDNYRQKQDKE